jgi:hypothetical protein
MHRRALRSMIAMLLAVFLVAVDSLATVAGSTAVNATVVAPVQSKASPDTNTASVHRTSLADLGLVRPEARDPRLAGRVPAHCVVHSATGVAAEDGLTALEQGASRVPKDWGPGLANKKGIGIRWTDPTNPGNGIRIDEGIPGSSWPSQQVDHVVVRSGGQILGPDGKPIVGSLAQNPQAHIPLSDWLNWSSWSMP